MGGHYFSRHLTVFLMSPAEMHPHRGLEPSQPLMISWAPCVEKTASSLNVSEAFSPTTFPASACVECSRKLQFWQIWLLSLPSAFLLSNCNAEVASKLTQVLRIYTSRGGTCTKYLCLTPAPLGKIPSSLSTRLSLSLHLLIVLLVLLCSKCFLYC